MTGRRNLRVGFALALAVAVLDQLSKWWIVEMVMQPPRVLPVTPFFNLVLGYNRGVSFGFLNFNSPLGRWFLVLLALAIVAVLVRWMWKADKTWVAAVFGMIIGGAIGNIVDRILVGAVVDFLDFHAAGYHWPAFNIADVAIVCGAAGLIWDSAFNRPPEG
ncbi:MAG: signal peptidase II [Magnetovibrio sp.]|nr:signal peptidase II [Magnetovibrio sp.]